MNKVYAFTPHYDNLKQQLLCVNLLPVMIDSDTAPGLWVLDYETMATKIRPLPKSIYSSEAIIVYCGSENVEWSSTPKELRKLLKQLSKNTRVYYAVVGPGQVRSCDLPGEGAFVYNSWEHQTAIECSHWWRYHELEPTRDILWMSRRIAPERMAIYHHLTHQTKHSVYASMGNTNYWGTNEETWRNHFDEELYADPQHAHRFYTRVGNHRDIQLLPRAFTHVNGSWNMTVHDIMGAGGIGIAIGNVRCVWLSDSHAHVPNGSMIHTEKLFKAFAVGRSVHPFGSQYYIQDLVELGYDFEIPSWDSIASTSTRLREYIHSEPIGQDSVHNRSVLHHRTQNNPLPKVFEQTRRSSKHRTKTDAELWRLSKKAT